MDEGIARAVEDWETRPFSGGYRGLHDLADGSFSGAVEADGTWCLFINGRAVGVYEAYGDEQEPTNIERFEGASGTVHEAPHDSLPLLFAMQLQGGELVARHPTSDRPLEEIHRELSEEGFTGYLELSEHVLSGDYYVVYQGGRSMNAAFIGNARRLRTGDEAFERATTEVGVYEAYAVPIEVVDIPEPADDGGAGQVAGAGAVADGRAAGEPEEPAPDESEPAPTAVEETASEDDAADEDVAAAVDGLEDLSTESAPDDSAADAEPAAEPTPAEDVDPAAEPSTAADTEPVEEPAPTEEPEPEPEEASERPADTTEPTAERPASEPDEQATGMAPAAPSTEHSEPAIDEETSGTERAPPATGGAAASEEEVDALAERVDSLASEQERLAEKVDRLDSLLSDLVTDGEDVFEPAERYSPEDALAATTLLIRYDAESGPKLSDVVAGTISEDALAGNLRFEPRTPFAIDETAVDGQHYAAFLDEALEPRFVEWLVGDLPFEVRRANATTALGPLYEALPSVDRARFGTEAALAGHAFDATLLTRDGDPVVVVRTETATDPPDEGTYEALVRAATEVREEHPSLVGAFLVTAGYVDGAELDPIREATRDRVLSRSKRESYVNLSGGGFHLCVVEAGDESFHLEVPGL